MKFWKIGTIFLSLQLYAASCLPGHGMCEAATPQKKIEKNIGICTLIVCKDIKPQLRYVKDVKYCRKVGESYYVEYGDSNEYIWVDDVRKQKVRK
jgi:hypothetical protein